MRGWSVLAVAGLFMLASGGGCASCVECGSRSAGASIAELESTLPPIEPPSIVFDVMAVGASAEVEALLAAGRDADQRYYALSAEQCQCMAVAASTQGNSLAAERRSILASKPKKGLSEESRQKVQVLWASEQEARNKSAGGALEAFYRLAEAETNMNFLRDSLQELDNTLMKVAELRAQQVEVPPEASELDRERLTLLDRRAELEHAAWRLNNELIRLIGLQTEDPQARLWPVADWQVVVEQVDVESAVALGLETRPEIGLLESLSRSQSASTLGVSRQLLSGASGLLGVQSKFASLIPLLGIRDLFGQRRANEQELPVRQRQMAEHKAQRRQEVEDEIREAAHAVETRLRQIALAKETSLSWTKRIEQLTELRTTEQATFLEISQARLSSIQSQSDEVARIVNWQVAIVQLRAAQGLLVTECGVSPCDGF